MPVVTVSRLSSSDEGVTELLDKLVSLGTYVGELQDCIDPVQFLHCFDSTQSSSESCQRPLVRVRACSPKDRGPAVRAAAAIMINSDPGS